MDLITPELAIGYGLVAAASYALPGPDMAIIAPRALRGWRAGVAAAAGVQTGMVVHCLLAIGGVSALIATRPALLTALQFAGGIYLIWLAIGDWRAASEPAGEAADTPRRSDLRGDFVAGVGANVINPKAILFFVAILPQFVPVGADVSGTVIQLAVLDIALGWVVWSAVIATATFVTRRGLSGTTQQRSARAMALLLGALGIVFLGRSLLPS